MILHMSDILMRLRRTRSRINGKLAQQALFLVGSLLALESAALIWIAMAGPRGAFQLAFWFFTATTLLSLGAASLAVRRRWLWFEASARLVDRQAHLDDRLASLIAEETRSPPSPLRPLLVIQLTDREKHWDPRVVAPRRVSRSIYALVAALAVLALAVRTTSQGSAPATVTLTEGDTTKSATTIDGKTDPAASSGIAQRTTPPHRGGHHPMTRSRLTGDVRGVDSEASRSDGLEGEDAAADGETAAPESNADRGSTRAEDDSGDAISEKLQDAIRQTLGAQPLAPPKQLAASQSRDPLAPAAGKSTEQTTGGESDPHATGAAKRESNSPNEGGRTDSPQSGPTQDGESNVSEGGSARAGQNPSGAGGPGADGLFADKSAGRSATTGDRRTFPMKLTGSSTGMFTQMEPQIPSRTPQAALSAPGTASASSGHPLNIEQRREAALHKTDIPAEHEMIVRRIFSVRE